MYPPLWSLHAFFVSNGLLRPSLSYIYIYACFLFVALIVVFPFHHCVPFRFLSDFVYTRAESQALIRQAFQKFAAITDLTLVDEINCPFALYARALGWQLSGTMACDVDPSITFQTSSSTYGRRPSVSNFNSGVILDPITWDLFSQTNATSEQLYAWATYANCPIHHYPLAFEECQERNLCGNNERATELEHFKVQCVVRRGVRYCSG